MSCVLMKYFDNKELSQNKRKGKFEDQIHYPFRDDLFLSHLLLQEKRVLSEEFFP